MASKRTRSIVNIALLAAVIALGLLVFMLSGKDAEQSVKRLSTLKAGEVERIHIHRPDRPDIELERRDQGWFLVRPFAIAASPGRIEDITDILKAQSRNSYPAKDLELAKYGLERRDLSLRLNNRELIFGDTNPINRLRYVLLGDRVHLIADTVSYLLEADTASYVGPSLLPAGADIQRLSLPGLSLSREGEGPWVSEPRREDLGSDAIQTLITAWKEAQALWAKPYQDEDAGKAAGDIRITLTDGREIAFSVLADDPDLILARTDVGIAYTLDGSQAGVLLMQDGKPAADQ